MKKKTENKIYSFTLSKCQRKQKLLVESCKNLLLNTKNPRQTKSFEQIKKVKGRH